MNSAVHKFLQFQISVNMFVSAVASSGEESILSVVQMLWINIILDALVALALATDSATPALLDQKFDHQSLHDWCESSI